MKLTDGIFENCKWVDDYVVRYKSTLFGITKCRSVLTELYKFTYEDDLIEDFIPVHNRKIHKPYVKGVYHRRSKNYGNWGEVI